MLTALSVGAPVLPTTQFSVDWWRGLRDAGATHCLLVPTMIEMLLAQRVLDVVPLRTLIYGAAPMSPETLRRVLHTLPAVGLVSIFGQTEGSPITTLDADDHARAAAGGPTCWTPSAGRRKGFPCGSTTPTTRARAKCSRLQPHLSVHGEDGWLHTGDLGAVDHEGYLRLSGRRNDMVVRGGENVYPLEVEHVLVEHPGVGAAGVVGVPDPRLGETLAAFIVAAEPSRRTDHDELARFVRARLAGFKVPAYWYDVTELPLNGAGKLLRPNLLEQHLEQTART